MWARKAELLQPTTDTTRAEAQLPLSRFLRRPCQLSRARALGLVARRLRMYAFQQGLHHVGREPANSVVGTPHTVQVCITTVYERSPLSSWDDEREQA